MQKKSVLGTDPLKWLKGSDKKENTDSPQSDIDSLEKQAKKQPDPANVNREEAAVKQKEKPYKPIDVSETLKRQGNTGHEPSDVTGLYNLQEEKKPGTDNISDANRKTVLGKHAYDYHTKSRETTQKDSPATAFIIVYTVLLLILGFIVYRDLTKQIDRLETKLESVEKQLDAGLINYEDTKVNDVW